MARILLVTSILLAFAAPCLAADDDVPPILVTRQLLEQRGLRVGQEITLSPHHDGRGAQPFRIVGVYEPNPDPMLLTATRFEARLHLPDLIDLTVDAEDPIDADSVDAINVALGDPRHAEAVGRELARKAPLLDVASTVPGPGQTDPFVVLERFHQAISVVTVLGSTAFLLALMLMRADERRETVGILRLIGFSRLRALTEVLFEGLFIALAGALFGVLFAAAMEGLINAFFQYRYDTALVFVHITPSVAWRCVALAVPLGVLAGFVASWHLLRREVVELIRR